MYGKDSDLERSCTSDTPPPAPLNPVQLTESSTTTPTSIETKVYRRSTRTPPQPEPQLHAQPLTPAASTTHPPQPMTPPAQIPAHLNERSSPEPIVHQDIPIPLPSTPVATTPKRQPLLLNRLQPYNAPGLTEKNLQPVLNKRVTRQSSRHQ